MTIMLQLPFPPSVNRLWVKTRAGMRRSDEYVAWQQEAGFLAKAQHQKPITGPYKLAIHAARPDKRKRDLGNLEKGVSDLLQSLGLIRDDCDCEMITLRWVTAGIGITVLVQPAGVEAEP